MVLPLEGEREGEVTKEGAGEERDATREEEAALLRVLAADETAKRMTESNEIIEKEERREKNRDKREKRGERRLLVIELSTYFWCRDVH